MQTQANMIVLILYDISMIYALHSVVTIIL